MSIGIDTWSKRQARFLFFLSGILFAAGLIAEVLSVVVAAVVLYSLAAIAGLLFVLPSLFSALKKASADINTLMGIAVLGALVMGFYQLAIGTLDIETFRDGAIVIFLYQIGEHLEDWSLEKTQTSIQDLMQLAPETAHLVCTSSASASSSSLSQSSLSVPSKTAPSYASAPTCDKNISSVKTGAIVKVLPGERVPLDGTIVEGTSSLNEAPVTGESIPQDKAVGEKVYGGSLNVASPLWVKVSAPADAGMLARIVSMVEGAQRRKGAYETFIDRFAAIYTPIVVVAALITGVGIPLLLSALVALGQQDLTLQLTHFVGIDSASATFSLEGLWLSWAARALTLLVVSCPCALVISTPVSFVSAITRAARMGILVKGGAAFDQARNVSVVAFDKTGTLTQGEPRVVDVVPFSRAEMRTTSVPARYKKADLTKHQLLQLAAALEKNSTHPLAQAVVKAAAAAEAEEAKGAKAGTYQFSLSHIQEHAGCGVEGDLSHERILIGKPLFIADELDLSEEEKAGLFKRTAPLEARGATCLVLAQGRDLVGAVALSDVVRPHAKEAIEQLESSLAMKTVMLTGDNQQAAASVAQKLGIDKVAAALLPQDKVAYLARLKEEGPVAFVGDGINDAPALAAASLGITMSAAASDSALETANVALLSGDLEGLVPFFRLAKKTMVVVKENIIFALCIKITILILAILGIVGMGWAIFADTGVTLMVVVNGMRLMLFSRRRLR